MARTVRGVPWRRALAGERERAGVDPRPLVAVAAAVTVLGVVDVVPVWAGLPHHVALPPLDLFADVRVLLAEASSYPWFVADLLVVLAVRTVVLAAMLRAVDRAGIMRSLRFYALATPVALVAGTLSYAGVAAVYSSFLWAATGVSIVSLVVVGPIAWRPPPEEVGSDRSPGRSRTARPGDGRLGVVGYLGALLGVSLVSALGGTAVQVVALWATTGLTVVVARRLHGRGARTGHRDADDRGGPRDGAGRRGRRGPRVAGAVLGVLLVVTTLSADRVPTKVPGPPMSPASRLLPAGGSTPWPPAGTLFLVPGIGGSSGTSTIFHVDPAALGFDCGRTAYFSYAGTGGGAPQRSSACPITSGAPYRAEDTRRPLDELAATFRAQLAELTPPVVVVAHSQGGWVAAAGIDEQVVGSIDDVVLVGAFPRHERGYVLDGGGRGLVGTDALEVLMAGLRGTGATSFDPRAPLSRELLGTAGAVDGLMRSMPAGLRVATVTSALDLPVMPLDWQLPGAADLCPVYIDHGHLPLSAAAHAQIRDHLAGGWSGACPWWRPWPAQAFRAFGAPPP